MSAFSDWIQLTSDALRACRFADNDYTPYRLGKTQLANTLLVQSHLMPKEKHDNHFVGILVRYCLQWGIEQFRPKGERQWLDNRWRRYNVLYAPYFEGATFEQVATLVGVSNSAIYKSRRRAIQRLATILEHAQTDLPTRNGCIAFVCQQRYLAQSAENQRLLRFLSLLEYESAEFLRTTFAPLAPHPTFHQTLKTLAEHHLTHTNAEQLVIHPAMRNYVATQLSDSEKSDWENAIGRQKNETHQWLDAARHWLRGNHAEQAANILLKQAHALIAMGEVRLLQALLRQINPAFVTEITSHQIYIQLGQIALQADDVDTALGAFRTALTAPTPILQSEAHLGCARAYRRNNIDLALHHYANCISLASETGRSKHLLLDALLDRATLYSQERSDSERADADWQRANKLVEPHQHRLLTRLHHTRAKWHVQQQNETQSLQRQELAWISAEKSKQPDLMMRQAHDLGVAYVWNGDHARGLNLLQQSQQHAQAVGDHTIEAATYKTIGASYAFQGDYVQAIQYYQHALDLFQESGNETWQAAVYADLTEAYAEIVVKMRSSFQTAQTLATQTGANELQQYLNQLARIYPYLMPLKTPLNAYQQIAIDYVKRHGPITRKQYLSQTQRSKSAASRDLQGLVTLDLLKVEGQGRSTRYVLK
ncbi:MAG: tetratricopeptide repeat protein [Candidatus Promineifilaceae bacterium]